MLPPPDSAVPMSDPSTFVHPTAVIDDGVHLGRGVKVWHFCHVSTGATIGDRCKLGQNVYLAEGVTLGTNVKVQNNVSLYAGVTCGDDVFLGPSVVFTNVRNPRSAIDRRGAYAKTRVHDGATIGANATIVCGNDIGTYGFVGAGAVVTRDVPSFGLVVGNPARLIGYVGRAGEPLTFDAAGRAVCPVDGTVYERSEGVVRFAGPADP